MCQRRRWIHLIFAAIKDVFVAVLGAEPRLSHLLMQISLNNATRQWYELTSVGSFLPQLDSIVKMNTPLPIMFGHEAH